MTRSNASTRSAGFTPSTPRNSMGLLTIDGERKPTYDFYKKAKG